MDAYSLVPPAASTGPAQRLRGEDRSEIAPTARIGHLCRGRACVGTAGWQSVLHGGPGRMLVVPVAMDARLALSGLHRP